MKCVDSSEVMRFYAGQLSVERMELLDAHFGHCAKCAGLRDEIGTLAAHMRHGPDEFSDGDAIDEVMALIRMGKADQGDRVPAKQSFWRSWQTWLLVPSTAVATVILMLAFWPRNEGMHDDGFQSRGAETVNPNRWVSLQVFRATSHGYEPVHDVVATDDALAFAYLNRPNSQSRYLAIFAVDNRGEVFWYYPPSTTKEPKSISINNAAQPIELPEQVVHDLRPGLLRIFGIFSTEPVITKQVEEQLRRDLHAAQTVERMSHLGLNGVGQYSLLLQVRQSTERSQHR